MQKKIDWLEIETEYITTNIKQTELAKKYNLKINTIRVRASKNKWSEKREQHFKKILKKSCNNIAKKNSDKIAEITNNSLDALLEATKQIKEYEEVNSTGDIINCKLDNVQVKKLESIIKSLTNLQRVQLEKARLELEKAKIQNDEATENKIIEYMRALKGGLNDE